MHVCTEKKKSSFDGAAGCFIHMYEYGYFTQSLSRDIISLARGVLLIDVCVFYLPFQ